MASGIWGPLIAFGDDQQVFAMIQWIAASLARIPHFHFYTAGSSSLIKVINIVKRCITMLGNGLFVRTVLCTNSYDHGLAFYFVFNCTSGQC